MSAPGWLGHPTAHPPRHAGAEGTPASRGEHQWGVGDIAPPQTPTKPRMLWLKPQPVPTVTRVRSHTHTHVPPSQMWDHKTLQTPSGDETQGQFPFAPRRIRTKC